MPFVDLSQQNQNNTPANSGDDSGLAELHNGVPVASTTASPADGSVQNASAAQSLPQDATQAPAMPAPMGMQDGQANSQADSQTTNSTLPKPPSELNSLNISEEDTEKDGSTSQADNNTKSGVELSIDDQGVKSMEGPKLPNPPGQTTPSSSQPAQNEAQEIKPVMSASSTQQAPVVASTNPVPATNDNGLPPLDSNDTAVIGGAIAPDAMPAQADAQQPADTIMPQSVQQATQPAAQGSATVEQPKNVVVSEGSRKSANVLEGVDTSKLLPADSDIETLTAIAHKDGASDIHFAANYPVFMRKDGSLYPVTNIIDANQAMKLATSMLRAEVKKKRFEEEKEVDLSFTNKEDVRFRVNLYTERGNAAGALRLINTNIRSVKELELPEILLDIINEPHGLVLLVGPTGSGKSTTLAAMLNHINLNRREHILTIEDPIEYVYPIGKSLVDQREIEADSMSWKAALKSALREDPNVVLVGEMRDLDTISSTITIAETGHLVFATLHTNSASQAIDRMIDVFPEGTKEQIRAQLANVIHAVISQRLIPIQGGGRRAGLEVMLGSGAVKNAIREAKTYQIDNIIQTSGDLGMRTLEKSLVEMIKKGWITKEQALEESVKPDDLKSLLSKAGM